MYPLSTQTEYLLVNMSLPVLLLVSLSALSIVTQGKTSQDADILQKSLEQTPSARFDRASPRESFESLNVKVKKINRRLEEVEKLRAEMKRINKELRSRRKESQLETLKSTRYAPRNLSVAFEVTQSKHPLNLHANQIIRFDTVVLNNGGGYHAGTGVFEAPVSGMYLFWANVLPVGGHLHIIMFHETSRLFVAFSQNDRTQCSLTYMVKVNRGEKVWFKTAGYLRQIHGGAHSAYGGALINTH